MENILRIHKLNNQKTNNSITNWADNLISSFPKNKDSQWAHEEMPAINEQENINQKHNEIPLRTH